MKPTGNKNGWRTAFSIVLILLLVAVAIIYVKSDKVSYLNSRLSTIEKQNNNLKNQTYYCDGPIIKNALGYTILNFNCNSNSGGANNLSCSGEIRPIISPESELSLTCKTQ